MIEGLRLTPWAQEQARRNPHIVNFDCARCREMNDRTARQAMGCGYEVPVAGARPWSPANLDAGHKGEFTICPGYTTKLPEVIEITRLVRHAKLGSLSAFLGKDQCTEIALFGMEVFDSSCGEVQSWALRPKDQGGGGH